jgi:hypothetical protein
LILNQWLNSVALGCCEVETAAAASLTVGGAAGAAALSFSGSVYVEAVTG